MVHKMLNKEMKTKIIDFLVCGVGIWLIGYIASIILYGLVPGSLLGWVIGIIFTPILLYVSYIRFRNRSENSSYFLFVAIFWTLIAIVFDYFFIVLLFKPENYYQLDVYFYYFATFLLPFVMGMIFGKKPRNS